jgi:hypothetical protein
MKRRGIRAFLVIAISLSIPIVQTYFHYYDLSEGNLPSLDLSFECPDQEILPIIKQIESKILLSSPSSIILSSEIIHVEQYFQSSSILCFIDQETPILRC